MSTRCVAGFCSNTRADGVSLFKFPKDAVRRHQWTRQVQRTREKWTLTDSSVLCSAHFEDTCFDSVPQLKQSLGLKVLRPKMLIPSAVPTLFPRPRPGSVRETSTGANGDTAAKSRKRSSAVEKRAKVAMINELLGQQAEAIPNQLASETDTGPMDSSNSLEDTHVDAATQVQIRPPSRTVGTRYQQRRPCKGVQACPQLTDSGTQTYISDVLIEESDEDEPEETEETMSDEDYTPSDVSLDSDSEVEMSTDASTSPCASPQHTFYLVFWSSLVQLLTTWCSCPMCGSRRLTWPSKQVGTLLQLSIQCMDCGHGCTWNSQPSYGKTAAGNILLSAAILFAGASATKVLRVLSHMGVAVISIRSYFRHQQHILYTAVRRVWRERQLWMLCTLQDEREDLVCGGDGRADSPGHSAKFGTYTMMELRKKAVIDIQVVQSNEVGGSFHMEQEGLKRSLQKVENHIHIGTLVTDRHVSICKMMRQDHPDITHLFDIWHVAKSIKKKLQVVSRTADCRGLAPWIASVVNHLYWSVVSTPHGNGDLVIAKWMSVLQHMHNVHDGFEGLFPGCTHGPLVGRERRKPWLTPGTKVSLELDRIVSSPRLCADIRRLSPVHQTSYVEAFHSLVIHFTPKMFAYSYDGMECRTILAALHFNENAHRSQTRTKDGELVYSVHFPKYKKDDYIVRKVLESATFEYVTELKTMVEAICCREDYDGDETEDLLTVELQHLPLSAACNKPLKKDAVRAHVNRFLSE